MSGDNYVWSGSFSGDWDTTSDWTDLTTNQTPATVAPGPLDAVTFNYMSPSPIVVSGDATVASLTLNNSLQIDGQVAAGSLSLTPYAGQTILTLAAGASLMIAGGATLASPSGGISASGGSLDVAGVVGGSGFIAATYGGAVQVGGVSGQLSIGVDTQSSFEVGALGDAQTAELLVDSGATLAVGGGDVFAPLIVNNGTIDGGNFGYPYGPQLQNDPNHLNETTDFTNNETTTDADASLVVNVQNNFTNTGEVTIGAFASSAISALNFINNGTVNVIGPATFSGDITGTGQVILGQNAHLVVNGQIDSTVNFAGPDAVLEIASQQDPLATQSAALTNFASSDAIWLDTAATSASWANGVLTIDNGPNVVERLNLPGNFANAQFFVASFPSGNTTKWEVGVYGPGDTTTAPAGTAGADSYLWTGGAAGSWDQASNWTDQTASQTPAAVAPGANDAVTIGAAPGVQVISGTGAASSLTVNGYTWLTGSVTTQNLTVGYSALVTLNTGARLNATGAAMLDGEILADGGSFSAAAVSADGDDVRLEAQNGGAIQVGAVDHAQLLSADATSSFEIGTLNDAVIGELVVDSGASVSGGGYLYAANAVVNNGTINGGDVGTRSWPPIDGYIYASSVTNNGLIDDLSSINSYGQTVWSGVRVEASGNIFNSATGSIVGNGGGYIASTGGDIQNAGTISLLNGWSDIQSDNGGTITNTGSITLSGYVSIYTYGGEIDNEGTITFNQNTQNADPDILVGNLVGSGSIDLGVKANLAVNGAVAATQQFNLSAGAILEIQNQPLNASFNGTITGFSNSNTIFIDGLQATSASWANGVLTLFDNGQAVYALNLSGDYAGDQFIAIPNAPTGYQRPLATQIDLAGSGDTTTPPPGTASADSYLWTGDVAGSWDDASNWTDQTAGQTPAAVAPGANDAVTIDGAAEGIRVVSGTGAASSLTINGDTWLTGSVTTQTLTVAYPALVTLNTGARLDAGDATLIGEVLANGGRFNAGAVSDPGDYVTLEAQNGGAIQLGSVDDALLLSADATSSFEIGTGNNAANGKLVVDSGASVTSNWYGGSFYAPTAIINNGTINGGDVGSRYWAQINGDIYTSSVKNNGLIDDLSSINNYGQTVWSGVRIEASGNIFNSATGSIVGNGGGYIASTGGGIQNAGTISLLNGWSDIQSDNGGTITNTGSITLSGYASIYTYSGEIDNEGTITFNQNTQNVDPDTLVGNLVGSGSIDLGVNANLAVNGAVAATQQFNLSAGAILEIQNQPLNTRFSGTITGFSSSNTIFIDGLQATSAAWSNGALTLFDNGQAVYSLDLSGDYAGDQFIAIPNAPTGHQRPLATEIALVGSGDTTTPPPGTASADSYLWTGDVAGSWDDASNWTDQTAGQSPAAVAPGANDAVTINGAAEGIRVISGTGAASSLTVNGDTWLTGSVTTRSLTVNADTWLMNSVTTQNLTVADPALVTLNTGAWLNDTGAATLTGEVFANGGRFNAGAVSNTGGYVTLEAQDGGAIQVGPVGDASLLSADATSSVEIGTLNDAVTGELVVDTGASVTAAWYGGGNLYAPTAVINNGTINGGDVGYRWSPTGNYGLYTSGVTNNGLIDSLQGVGYDDQTIWSGVSINAVSNISNSALGSIILNGSGYFYVQAGDIQNAGTISLNAGGSIYAANGGSPGNGGTITNTGSITIGGYASITAYGGEIDNEGEITFNQNTQNWYPDTLAGNLVGSGSVSLNSGANVQVGGSVASGQQFDFGPDAILELENSQFGGTINGFTDSDTLFLDGVQATSAAWSNGVLTLSDNGQTVETINLAGDYAGESFLVIPGVSDHGSSSATQVNLIGQGDTATPPPPTNSADEYVWAGPAAGSWDNASNWTDQTLEQAQAAAAPGSNDAITIPQRSEGVQVISGTGAADSLTVNGDLWFTGAVETRALTIAQNTTVTLHGGGSLTASGSVTMDDRSGVVADGGAFDVAGTIAATPGGNGISLEAEAGGSIHVGGVNGSVTLFADTQSSLEIGGANVATAGQIVIDSGASATVNGPQTIWAPEIINNGVITHNESSGEYTEIGWTNPNGLSQSFDNFGEIDVTAPDFSIASSIISNNGIINVSASGIALLASIDNPLTNNGQINVSGYLNLLYSTLTGSGVINIQSGGVLWAFAGTTNFEQFRPAVVSENCKINMSGSGDKLGISDGISAGYGYYSPDGPSGAGDYLDEIRDGNPPYSQYQPLSVLTDNFSTFNGVISGLNASDSIAVGCEFQQVVYQNGGLYLLPISGMQIPTGLAPDILLSGNYYGYNFFTNYDASTDTTTITLAAAQPPELSNSGSPGSYVSTQSPAAVAPALSVQDPGYDGILDATVTITDGFLYGDTLNFANQNGISGVYNAATGQLTLSGEATLMQYQQALQSITFSSTLADATESGADTARTVSFVVNNGQTASNLLTTTLAVAPAPIPTLSNPGAGTYLLGGAATAVAPGLSVSGSAATLSGATVTISQGLLAGDQLNFANQSGITGVYNAATGTLTLTGVATASAYQAALESITYSSTALDATEDGSDPSRAVTMTVFAGAYSSQPLTSTLNITSPAGVTYNLNTTSNTVLLGYGNDTVIARPGTLHPLDSIDGGGGVNTLVLQGAATFDLGVPAVLQNFAFVDAQEGQSGSGSGATAIASTRQTVYLRNGLNTIVNVASDPSVNPADPNAPGITIFGSNDSSTINLGNGVDTVTLGSAAETVNGGTGADTINAVAATAGALIKGGGGAMTINVAGGGAIALNAADTGVTALNLAAASTAYTLTANGEANLAITDNSATADTISGVAASDIVNDGSASVRVQASTANAGVKVFGGTGSDVLELLADGASSPETAVLNAATAKVQVKLDEATNLVLSKGVNKVSGSGQGDTITATSANITSTTSLVEPGGNNTLVLQGAANFNLAPPAALSGFGTIEVSEGQNPKGSIPTIMQGLTLRSGLDATVDVTSISPASGDPNPVGIIITGAAGDSSTINLGNNADTVTLGSSAETVHGGTGTDAINATATTAGTLIKGGGGTLTMNVTGGGVVDLNAADSGISEVVLKASTSAYAFTADAQNGLLVDDASSSADTLAAGGSGQTFTGGAAGKATFVASNLGGDTFMDTTSALNGDTIDNFGAAAGNQIDLTDLNFSKLVATFSENAAGTEGQLMLTDGSHSATVNLFGQFAAAGFSGSAAAAGFSFEPDNSNTPPLPGTLVAWHG